MKGELQAIRVGKFYVNGWSSNGSDYTDVSLTANVKNAFLFKSVPEVFIDLVSLVNGEIVTVNVEVEKYSDEEATAMGYKVATDEDIKELKKLLNAEDER